MKLAELLIERSELTKRLHEIKQQVFANLKTQEGVALQQDPNEAIAIAEKISKRLCEVVTLINKTNATVLLDGKLTIADAIAKRDSILGHRNFLQSVIVSAREQSYRSTKTEIKILTNVNVAELQKSSDALAKQYRELDTKIQEKNWITEVK